MAMVFMGKSALPLAAAARRAASIALETGAVAHEGEISAFLTRFAFIALHPRLADEVRLAPLGRRFDGTRDGLADRRRYHRFGGA